MLCQGVLQFNTTATSLDYRCGSVTLRLAQYPQVVECPSGFTLIEFYFEPVIGQTNAKTNIGVYQLSQRITVNELLSHVAGELLRVASVSVWR